MQKLNIKKGIITAGNHDKLLESEYGRQQLLNYITNLAKQFSVDLILALDEVITLKNNITLFISPYYKRIGSGTYFGFSYFDEMTKKLFEDIQEINPDLLVTHGPPFDLLDYTDSDMFNDKENYGCKIFKQFLNNPPSNLKNCVFGHIHERGNDSIKFNNINLYNVADAPRVILIEK